VRLLAWRGHFVSGWWAAPSRSRFGLLWHECGRIVAMGFGMHSCLYARYRPVWSS